MATIRPRKGKWQVQVRVNGFEAQSKTFRLKKDAELWAAEIERRLRLHDMPVSRKVLDKVSLEELVNRYCAERLPHKRSGKNERIILQAFLKRERALAKKSLATITKTDLVRYRDQRLLAVKSSTLRRELNPLRHMFNIARSEWELPIENPLHQLVLPAEPAHRQRLLRHGELSRLIAMAIRLRGGERCRMWMSIIWLATSTGMRRGELLGLTWDDIDFHRRTIQIRHSKNGKIRTLPMSYESERYLRHLYESGEPTLSKSESSNQSSSARVIRLTKSAFEQAWRRIVARAGSKDLHFHDLRHEAASTFEQMGLTRAETEYMLGHSSKDMTSRYVHPVLARIQRKFDDYSYQKHRSVSKRKLYKMPLRGDEALALREKIAIAVEEIKKKFDGNIPEQGSDDWQSLSKFEQLNVRRHYASESGLPVL